MVTKSVHNATLRELKKVELQLESEQAAKVTALEVIESKEAELKEASQSLLFKRCKIDQLHKELAILMSSSNKEIVRLKLMMFDKLIDVEAA